MVEHRRRAEEERMVLPLVRAETGVRVKKRDIQKMKAEIEVKAKVKDRERLMAKIGELGCALSEPIRQEDEIFVDFSGPLLNHGSGKNILRIRRTADKAIFTLKRNREEDELDCIEKEVEISEAGTFKEILGYLGYREAIKVKKVRRKGIYGDYEICLDEVEGLGDFIEVEKMSEEDGKKIQEELMVFLRSLGVREEDRVFKGYDSLLEEKKLGKTDLAK